MSKASDDFCKVLLAITRKELGAKPEERIDKRYYTSVGNGDKEYLAPDNMYYRAHCGYCAETKYLEHIYRDEVLDDKVVSVDYKVVNVPANFKDLPNENLYILANNLGITWKKSENIGINRMRCIMALKKASNVKY